MDFARDTSSPWRPKCVRALARTLLHHSPHKPRGHMPSPTHATLNSDPPATDRTVTIMTDGFCSAPFIALRPHPSPFEVRHSRAHFGVQLPDRLAVRHFSPNFEVNFDLINSQVSGMDFAPAHSSPWRSSCQPRLSYVLSHFFVHEPPTAGQ